MLTVVAARMCFQFAKKVAVQSELVRGRETREVYSSWPGKTEASYFSCFHSSMPFAWNQVSRGIQMGLVLPSHDAGAPTHSLFDLPQKLFHLASLQEIQLQPWQSWPWYLLPCNQSPVTVRASFSSALLYPVSPPSPWSQCLVLNYLLLLLFLTKL